MNVTSHAVWYIYRVYYYNLHCIEYILYITMYRAILGSHPPYLKKLFKASQYTHEHGTRHPTKGNGHLSPPKSNCGKKVFNYSGAEEDACNAIRSELAPPTTLALYDPAIPIMISANASAYGLDAILLQQQLQNTGQRSLPMTLLSLLHSKATTKMPYRT